MIPVSNYINPSKITLDAIEGTTEGQNTPHLLEFDAKMSRQDADSTALRIIYAMHSDAQNIDTNDTCGTS